MERDEIGIRQRLRAAARAAMRERDRSATATYRTAIAAIDNAEAVPLGETDRAGAIEAASTGVGSTEAVRRELSESDQRSLVASEAAELVAAGRDHEAALLQKVLQS